MNTEKKSLLFCLIWDGLELKKRFLEITSFLSINIKITIVIKFYSNLFPWSKDKWIEGLYSTISDLEIKYSSQKLTPKISTIKKVMALWEKPSMKKFKNMICIKSLLIMNSNSNQNQVPEMFVSLISIKNKWIFSLSTKLKLLILLRKQTTTAF